MCLRRCGAIELHTHEYAELGDPDRITPRNVYGAIELVSTIPLLLIYNKSFTLARTNLLERTL